MWRCMAVRPRGAAVALGLLSGVNDARVAVIQ